MKPCRYCGKKVEKLEWDGACSNSCRLGSKILGEYWVIKQNHERESKGK